MKRCKIIAYEGPDRVGKATQSNLLYAFLKEKNYKVIRIEVPAKYVFYDLIYKMLKNGYAKKYPNIFQFIQFMNKFLFQFFVFLSYYYYDYIIFDRWDASFWVYGLASGANPKLINFLIHFIKKPDITFILNGKPQIEVVRDDYEKDRKLQERVRTYYIIYFESFIKNENIVMINANQDKDKIFDIILKKMNLKDR